MLKKYIGDKAFYKKVLVISVPILIQNIITNFVSLLDNVMVGQVGTEQMSGVAIVNQLIMVFNLCIFGAISGAGIFSAQFYGKGDTEGVRSTFRVKVIFVTAITILAETVLMVFGESLISLFLHEGEDGISIVATLEYALDYLKVILITLPIFAIMQAYTDTLKSTGETLLPMQASATAVGINIVLNYVFIFGKFGVPAMGVVGAALATLCARVIECSIVIIRTHLKRNTKYKFIKSAYRSMYVPLSLWKSVAKKGIPLMMNEVMWSLGMTVIVQAYSIKGIEVVSGLNISTTVTNLFNCAFFAIGSAIAIMIGQLLGAGQVEKAIDEDRKLMFCAVSSCVIIGGIMALLSPLIPMIYNTTDTVKKLATEFLLIGAFLMPIHAFCHAAYFTLRSGGRVIITFIFDSVFVWCVSIPVAYILTRFTDLPIIPLYICVQFLDILKVISGYIMLKSKIWARNIVAGVSH